MTIVLSKQDEDVVLSDAEKTAWESFVISHQEEFRGVMSRALFDDVRPDWEEYFALKEASEPVVVSASTMSADDLRAAMYRALFDDVRPDWERRLAAEEQKSAA